MNEKNKIGQQYLADNIIEIYQKYGRAWTQLRGDFLYERNWLDWFLALLPVSASILDLGCGSGRPIAGYLIKRGHHITGVDSSGVMIEMAKQYFPEQVWLQQDMRKLNLSSQFAGILAWDSFFHLSPTEQRKMFARFARHAAPDAALMFTSGPEYGEAIGDMFGEPLYHASLASKEYEQLLEQNDFKVVKMVAEDRTCTGHTVWLAQKADK